MATESDAATIREQLALAREYAGLLRLLLENFETDDPLWRLVRIAVNQSPFAEAKG